MKKQIAVAMGLAVLSGSAFASKARLQSLGGDVNGSMYLSDNRNIFLNAAHVNFHKDIVTVEAGASATTDSTANPKAEGGFLKANGNMVYGAHFGNVDSTMAANRNVTGVAVNHNTWDFFVGGDAGVQWGASLSYADFKDEANDDKAGLMKARLGMISGDIEGFLNATITDTKEDDGVSDYEVKSNYDLGVSYNHMGTTYMARYTAFEVEDSEVGDESFSRQTISLGAGRVNKLNDKANFNVDAMLSQSTDTGSTAYASDDETKTTNLAATMGLEVMAKDWLTLRASISQNLYNEVEADNGDKSSGSDSTSVNAGASLVFGDLTVDGLVGNSDGSTIGDDTSAGNGAIRSDSLLTRVSATYRF